MKNKVIWVLALLWLSLNVKAAPVSLEAAKQTARAFYGVQCMSATAKSMPEFVCVYPESKDNAFVPYYIFNVGADNGFVIVAGDDNATRLVLAYSDNGRFETGNIPDNVRGWLRFYEEGVHAAAASSVSVSHTKGFAKAEVVKGPLLGNIGYNQDAPYNDLCPIDPQTDKVSYTGCVATALATIARYYRYPERGRDSIYYVTGTRRIPLSMNFSKNVYDWENMLETYRGNLSNFTQAQRTAVATLMRDMGYAVQMDYTSNASGAFREPSVRGMVNYMGFDSIISHRDRTAYDNDKQWIAMLKANIDLSQPVYYTGQSTGGGHAFITDGYDAADYFHFDWGWGKSYNGYFSVHNLNPDGSGIGGSEGGYSDNQAVMCNLVPEGHTHSSDDYFIVSTSAIEPTNVSEGETYSKKDSIRINLSGFYNYTMSRFEGTVALAAFKDDEFIGVVSNEESLQIGRYTSGTKEMSLYAVLEDLEEGEYEIWAVQKSNREDAVWNKVFGSRRSLISDSYVPVLVEGENFRVLPVGANIKISMDCAVTRNIDMEIWSEGVLVSTRKVPSTSVTTITLRYGTYDFLFYTRGFDTTHVRKFELTEDTVLHVEMHEIFAPPYLGLCVVNGNTAKLHWKAYNPREEPVYPTGYVMWLDSVESVTVGSGETSYLFTNLERGDHQVGVQSIYARGRSEVMYRTARITEDLVNEQNWQNVCRITPNPSSTGYFKVEAGERCRVQVCGMTGNILFERYTDVAGVVEVDMTAYTAGVYLFRLESEDGRTAVLKAVLR